MMQDTSPRRRRKMTEMPREETTEMTEMTETEKRGGPVTDDRVQQSRLGTYTSKWLDDRTARMLPGDSRPEAVRRELEMWQTALDLEAGTVAWTLPEACCLADIVAGSVLRPGLGLTLRARVGNAKGVADKWGIDADSFAEKVGRLGVVADHAVSDALSRWWDRVGTCPEDESTAAGFRAVGLRIIDGGNNDNH
jgi:hypothetical protein